jgi:hypothetical protein
MTKDDIKQALEDCLGVFNASNCPFTDWEKEFLESVDEQFAARGGLSEKQQDRLEAIWGKI